MLTITLIPCLQDNYAYLLEAPGAVAVVDPSEPGPVMAVLMQRSLKLTHILNTHHHFDHTGGNEALKRETGAVVIGPAKDAHRIPALDRGVGEGDTVDIGGAQSKVLDIPGHTSGHIAFWFEQSAAVFTGDTMFAMGCGRLFEGTPAQMWASLSKLAALPGETRVYCGHEYTLSNGRFALTVDSTNGPLQQRMLEVERLRAQSLPTIPTTIALERATNPFLRASDPSFAKGLGGGDAVSVFAETRAHKDRFKG